MNDYSFNTVFGKAWGKAMTIPNAAAAFHTTGVYPFDRTAVKIVDTIPSLRKSSGLHYIPVLSPAPQRRRSTIRSKDSRAEEVQTTTFSPDARADLDETSSEDLQPDNLLLNKIPQKQSVISRFYPDSRPEVRLPKFYEKADATVLTGRKHRKEMAEKQRLKTEKIRLADEKREEKIRLADEKKKEKIRLADEKRKEREAKKAAFKKKPLTKKSASKSALFWFFT